MVRRVRTRGGDAPAVVPVSLSQTEKFVTCSMSVSGGYRPKKIPSTVSCSMKNIYISDPAFAITTYNVPSKNFTWSFDSRYEYYYVSGINKAELLSYLQGVLMPFLHDRKYAEAMIGTVTRGERVYTYTAERMVDEVGSGFNKRRKTEFIVNPMDSERNLFLLFGGDAPAPAPLFEISDIRWAGNYVYFVLHAKAETDVPFSVPAFNTFRANWLDELNPSGYGHLYSKACQAIDEGSMEILATIGELRETVSYLYKRLSTIGTILKAVKNRDFSFFKKVNISKADLWLEARYAIRPLFYDVQSILAVLRSEGKLRNTVAKKSSTSDESTSLRNFSFTSDNVSYVVKGQQMTQLFAQGGAYARLAMDLELAYRLGATNIASAAWELVPYSFIVDWFFSVSSFIAGLNPNPVYTVEAGFVSVSRKDFFTGTIYGTYNGKTKAFGFSDAVQRHSRIPYDNRFNISLDINLNFHKFVDLCLIFGRR